MNRNTRDCKTQKPVRRDGSNEHCTPVKHLAGRFVSWRICLQGWDVEPTWSDSRFSVQSPDFENVTPSSLFSHE